MRPPDPTSDRTPPRLPRRFALLLVLGVVAVAVSGCFLFPNLPPVCEMTVEPASGHAPLTVRLDATASSDSDGIVVGYFWTFGDGSTAQGTTTEHTFETAGTYSVELVLCDEDGDETSQTTEVVVEPPNEPPVVLFSVTPAAVVVDDAIRFDASASHDPDGSIVAFAWNFGDETTGTGVEADHVYEAHGTYTVTLTATDDDGASATTTRFALVAAAAQGESPNAVFAPTSATIDVGDAVQFDASASSSPNGNLVDFAWDFGDGGSGAGAVTGHAFTTAGTFTVLLIVTDEAGATAAAYGSVYVGVDPPADGETVTRSYWWEYGGQSRSLLASIPVDLYDWATSQSRGAFANRDYDEYVLSPHDDALMAEIAAALSLGSYKSTVENALAFVQMCIAYQVDPGVFEYPRYPVETLVDEVGDCEDTAILYASLIRTLGHGALLVAVDTNGDQEPDHMVVFVPIDDTFPTCGMDCVWEYEGQLYAMAETAVDGGYLALGQDPWGLDPGDIHETWDVSRVDRTPQMVKRVPKQEP